MRLTFILIIFSMVSVCGKGLSQKINLTLSNTPLDKAFEQIGEQSGYSFIWNDRVLDKNPRISVHLHNAGIEEVLKACFTGLDLEYSVKGKIVIISPKKPLPRKAVVQNGPPVLQERVQGRVLDSLGRPLEGVTVFIAGTKVGTVTDRDGRFYLDNIDPEKITLIISHVGFKESRTALNGRTNIIVVLKAQIHELDNMDVTVSTGYQDIHKERVTGAVSVIDAKEFNTRITTGSILSGLQSRVAGVMINGDITYKGNNLFQVRGISTMNANAAPLIVVDGLPTDLTIDQINPNEVANIYVLKDAAAASIYGTRASNGVVVVERIKGKTGKPQVQLISTLSATPSVNHLKSRYAKNDNAFISYMQDQAAIYGFGDISSVGNSSYRIQSGAEPFYRYNSGLIDTVQLLNALDSMRDYNNAKDYRRLFEQTALTQQYDLNVSGGNESMRYFVSGNVTSNRLNEKGNSNRSASLSARLNFKFNKRVKLAFTEDFISLKGVMRPVPAYKEVFPFEKYQDEMGNALPVVSMSSVNPYYNARQVEAGFQDYMYYPLTENKEVSTTTKGINNKLTGHLSVNLIKGLDINLYGVYEVNTTSADYYASERSSAAKSLVDYYAYAEPDASLGYMIPIGGFATSNNQRMDGYTGRLQVNYGTVFNKKHQLDFILGAEFRSAITTTNKSASFGFNDQTLLQGIPDLAGLFSKDHYYSPYYSEAPYTESFTSMDNLFGKTYGVSRFGSGYFNGIYTYNNRYNLSVSGRVDQSNLFGTNPKYVNKPLWSVGAAWNIDKESFMQGVQWVDLLKFRISSGFNGNVATNVLPQVIAQYKLLDQVVPNIPSLRIFSPANSGLRWEQTYNFNAGLDFGLHGKVTGSIDYYKKISKDLLATGSIDPTKGYDQAMINAGSMINNGVELTLHADWISTRKFNWNTGVILSYNKNKVTDIYNSSTATTSYNYLYAASDALYIKGYSVNPVFAYRFAGLNDIGLPMIYTDASGAEKIHLSYDNNYLDAGNALLSYEGNGIPTTNIGVSNRFDIGRLYIYFMVDLYTGFKTRIPAIHPNDTHSLPGAENYYRKSGDEKKTDIMGFYDYTKYVSSDYFIYENQNRNVVNGGYLTLRDITVAYRLNEQFLKKTGIADFTIKAQVTNVFTRGFNSYNYSVATGDFAQRNLTPTYTLGVFMNF